MKSNTSPPSKEKFPYIRKKKTDLRLPPKKKVESSRFSSKSIFNLFSKIDMFGVAVTLTYKGRSSHSTVPGIIASILVFALIGSFAVYQFYLMIFGLNPKISELVMMRDLHLEPEYKPYVNDFTHKDDGFDFAIELSEPNLDPKIAYIEVHEITSRMIDIPGKETVKVKTKRTLPTTKCGSEGFSYSDKSEIKRFHID